MWLRILIFAFSTLTASCAFGMLADHDYSNKTVAQLLTLLESTNSHVREDAALFLGYRYRKPGIEVNPPTYEEQHPEFPLPLEVIPRLATHLKSDSDYGVRIEAVRALRDLRSCTNTTPVMVAGLGDTNTCVRIWTCSALIDVSQDYLEPVVASVVPALRQALTIDGDEDPTWVAAWISGHLGAAGRPLLPDLAKLSRHKSSKVRHYAREARKKIRADH
jgi:hypothetical protein